MRTLRLFAVMGLALLSTSPLLATTIVYTGSQVQDSIPGGGLGTDGYIFYAAYPNAGGSVTDVVSPVSYATVADAAGTQRYQPAPPQNNTYTSLTVTGTSYGTGLLYFPASGQHDLATITLANSGLPSSIEIALLGNNYNYNGSTNYTTSYTLTAGANNATGNVTYTGTGDQANRFYVFTLTNLTPGETITVSGVGQADGTLLGGIAFASVPEPSTAVLALLGALGLVAVRRRRSA